MRTKVQELRKQALKVLERKADKTVFMLIDYEIDSFCRTVLGLPDAPVGSEPYVGWVVGEKENKADPDCLSPIGQELIKRWEGCRLKAYQCSADVWTIGWGRTHNVKPGDAITKAQADAMFLEDIKIYEEMVDRLVTVSLTQGQYDALVSFCYNVGETQFKHSTLLRYLNRGLYDLAANELFKWVNAGGRKLLGLTNRRKEEFARFNS